MKHCKRSQGLKHRLRWYKNLGSLYSKECFSSGNKKRTKNAESFQVFPRGKENKL